MHRRYLAAFGLLALTLLSQNATARSGASGSTVLPTSRVGLELRSERHLGAGAPTVELRLTGGTPGASVWLVGVEAPADLVAMPVRLAGLTGGPVLRGTPAWSLVTLDGRGDWSATYPEASLPHWFQAVAPDPGGGFRFTEVTRGTRAPLLTTGSFSGSAPLQYGLVVVTEFMKDPAQVSDSAGEWVEVQNVAPHRMNLEGLVLSDDGSNGHLVFNGGAGLWFLPGERLVLGRNNDPLLNGGVTIDYAYSGFTLGNSADQIVLSGSGGRLLDRVAYDNGVLWPDSSGASISLAPGFEDPYANDDPASWCHASSFVASGSSDSGTPGRLNDVCP